MSDIQMDNMSDIVQSVFEMATQANQTGDWRRLNDSLSNAQFAIMNTDLELVAVRLRASSSFKQNLSAWTPLLHRAIEAGRIQGLNVDDIFYGLMSHD